MTRSKCAAVAGAAALALGGIAAAASIATDGSAALGAHHAGTHQLAAVVASAPVNRPAPYPPAAPCASPTVRPIYPLCSTHMGWSWRAPSPHHRRSSNTARSTSSGSADQRHPFRRPRCTRTALAGHHRRRQRTVGGDRSRHPLRARHLYPVPRTQRHRPGHRHHVLCPRRRNGWPVRRPHQHRHRLDTVPNYLHPNAPLSATGNGVSLAAFQGMAAHGRCPTPQLRLVRVHHRRR